MENQVMTNVEYFKNPSNSHHVESEEGGFSIMPINDGIDALNSFQQVAKLAIKYQGNDFRPKPHYESNNALIKTIDLVFFEKIV
jgi:hypothetical protein